jgi:uncharacterized membrane protein
MNRTVRIALVISIILNMLMLGVILGQSPRRFAPGALRQQRVEQTLKDLPAAEQARLRERLQKLRAAADPLFGQIRQAEAEAVDLLGRETFDEATYDRQVGKINEMRLSMTNQLAQLVKDATKDLSAAERRRFADLLRRPPPSPKS